MVKNYDLIVIGAGIPGCTLATILSGAGFKVALIDKKMKKKIGNDWEVTVDKYGFNRANIKFPDEKFHQERPERSQFFVEDPDINVVVEGNNFQVITIVHRVLNQYLLSKALNCNIDFFPAHKVKGAILEGDSIAGVFGHCKSNIIHKEFSFKSHIVVDASGLSAVVRKRLPEEFNIQKWIKADDLASAWQEVSRVKDGDFSLKKGFPFDKELQLTPGVNYTKVGKYHAYMCFLLRKDKTLNTIFGSTISSSKLAYSINKQFRDNHQELLSPISSAGGIIPVRRSLDNLVANGFLLLGDSACQVIPTMGSGIQSSLMAASIAGNVIIQSLNNKDYSKKFLWQYNYRYQRDTGAILASYDIIRRFMQTIPNLELHNVFKAGLIDDSNFVNTFSSSEIKFNISDMLDKFIRIFKHPKLLPLTLRFIEASSDSKKIFHLYQDYPKELDQETFNKWLDATENIFKKYRNYF